MRRIAKRVIFGAVFAVGSLVYVAGQGDQIVLGKDVRVLAYEELNYPPLARSQRIQGVVVVRVRLDDAGGVTDAVALSGVEALVRDCLENVKKWRFEPNAHKSAVVVYKFGMPGGECKSAPSMFMLERPNFAKVIGCDVK